MVFYPPSQDVFPEHEEQCERYRRRLNYGPNSITSNAVVSSDRLSLDVTGEATL